jgi:ubiquinone/menaquinone biosynthesis C-methylase UbiE
MAEGVKHFYDRLASNYHLIFEDWDASMKRQAAALGAILERECGMPSALRILDCACGIGTQTWAWPVLDSESPAVTLVLRQLNGPVWRPQKGV